MPILSGAIIPQAAMVSGPPVTASATGIVLWQALIFEPAESSGLGPTWADYKGVYNNMIESAYSQGASQVSLEWDDAADWIITFGDMNDKTGRQRPVRRVIVIS